MSELPSGFVATGRKQISRKRIESATTSEASSIYNGQPPDGGWGWVIVAASFAAHAIADGCICSFGVLFVELLDVFGESRASTAWIGSLFVAMPSVCAPIASVLTLRYGCRVTTIAGGFIAAIGCILSSFANSVGVLCFTFGVISGFGLALVFIPAVLIVAFYFEKRRAFATGIAVAGSGIGTFIFAPLTEYLITQFSWRGGLLVIGGLMLNLIVCGALFRPIATGTSIVASANPEDPYKVMVPTDNTTDQAVITVVYDDDSGDFGRVTSVSLVQFPTYFSYLLPAGGEEVPANQDLLFDFRSLHAGLAAAGPYQTATSTAVSTVTASADNILALSDQSTARLHTSNANRGHFLHSSKYNNVFYRGGLLRARMLLTTEELSASCPDIFIHSTLPDTASNALCHNVVHAMRNVFDPSIFGSAIFNLFCIHCFLLCLAYSTPYVYIPDVALGHGISADTASTLIAVIGVASTCGQVVMGYVGDRPEVNTLHFYVAVTTVAGVATLIVPALSSSISLSVYCSVFGFFISANYALTTIILVSLLGIERLTNAIGLVSMAGGVAILLGLPLAGWIADESGSYDPVFYVAGVAIAASALILLTVPLLRRCDSDKSAPTTSFGSVVEKEKNTLSVRNVSAV